MTKFKSFSVLMCVFLLGWLIAACGGNETNNTTAANNHTQISNSQANASNAQEEQSATRSNNSDEQTSEKTTKIYEHMAGSSEIPVKPEKIVTDWYYGQLVALGVKPIGTDDYVWNNHPFIPQEGTESIGGSLEKILSLEPDLIISWGASKYEDYSKIAPTVPLELSGGPIESVKLFGDLLGRTEEADQWIANFEEKTNNARQQLAEYIGEDETFSIINVWKDTIRVYGFVNMGGYALYEALGLKPSPLVESTFKGTDEWHREVSMEVLPDFAGDHIILTTYDPEGNNTTLQDLKDSEIWQSLDAVKNNQVYEVVFNHLYFDDPIAIEKQVEILTEAILNGKK